MAGLEAGRVLDRISGAVVFRWRIPRTCAEFLSVSKGFCRKVSWIEIGEKLLHSDKMASLRGVITGTLGLNVTGEAYPVGLGNGGGARGEVIGVEVCGDSNSSRVEYY